MDRFISDVLGVIAIWEVTMQSKGQAIKSALKCAFPYTIPIFAGFWFLGLTYGIYMNVSGFSFWYPMLSCREANA